MLGQFQRCWNSFGNVIYNVLTWKWKREAGVESRGWRWRRVLKWEVKVGRNWGWEAGRGVKMENVALSIPASVLYAIYKCRERNGGQIHLGYLWVPYLNVRSRHRRIAVLFKSSSGQPYFVNNKVRQIVLLKLWGVCPVKRLPSKT